MYPTSVLCLNTELQADQQIEILQEIVDSLPAANKFLLSWLLQHMLHIIAKVWCIYMV